MKYILKLLKKLFVRHKVKEKINNKVDNIKVTNINWKLINNLRENAIVYVKMNNDEISDMNIEMSHQTRPFLITKKIDSEKIVKGYYLTGNVSNNWFFSKPKYKNQKVILNKEDYKIPKNSLILYHKKIDLPYENIFRLVNYLQDKDLKMLKKYRNLLQDKKVISNRENNIIEIGDVVLENSNKYIIYQKDNTNCYGYLIDISNDNNINLEEDFNYFIFNDKLYFVDYKKNRIFNNNDILYIIKRFNDETVDLIRENKKKLKIKNKQNPKTKTKRKCG